MPRPMIALRASDEFRRNRLLRSPVCNMNLRVVSPIADARKDMCVFEVSEGGVILGCDANASRLLGYAQAIIVGSHVDSFMAMPGDGRCTHGETCTMGAAPSSANWAAMPVVARRADGSTFPVEITGIDMAGSGAQVRLLLMRDMTGWLTVRNGRAGQETDTERARGASADTIFERLQRLLAARAGDAALLSVELDGVEEVLASHGADIGAMLLQNVQARIYGCLRSEDVVARINDDEFVAIVVDGKDRNVIQGVAERIADSLQKAFWVQSREIFLPGNASIRLYKVENGNVRALIAKIGDAVRRRAAEPSVALQC